MEACIVAVPEAPLMFAMTDSSVKLATVYEKDLVEVVEKINELWWKVKYHDYIGYIRTNYLRSENFDADMVAVNLPRKSAIELYHALKLALCK